MPDDAGCCDRPIHFLFTLYGKNKNTVNTLTLTGTILCVCVCERVCVCVLSEQLPNYKDDLKHKL